MSSALAEIALACFLLGALIDGVFGTRKRIRRQLPYFFGMIGSGCLFALGIHATVSRVEFVNFSILSGAGDHALRVDPLAGLFLTLLFGLSTAISANYISWVQLSQRMPHRWSAAGYLLLLSSVAIIVLDSAAFMRCGLNSHSASAPLTAGKTSSSVSTASNSTRLSSCKSLL